MADAGVPDESACIHIVVRVSTPAVLVDVRGYGHVPGRFNNKGTSKRVAVMVQVRCCGIGTAVQVVVEVPLYIGFHTPFVFPVTAVC